MTDPSVYQPGEKPHNPPKKKREPKIVAPLLPLRSFSFEIPGDPFSWQRARVRVVGSFARHFESNEQRSWKGSAVVQMLAARTAAGIATPFAGPVGLTIAAYFACPKSDEKKRVPRPERWSLSQKDVDNIAKAVGDAGNGVLWNDDRQVVQLMVQKRIAAQGQPPRVLVLAEELRDS